ncbi:MAG: polymer-forming cytoskeletal protein [Thermodesulfovibrionales bacterium]|nr:polymer-forming cytoskeletal protein [Thermodesulfovibrionales bacterium]
MFSKNTEKLESFIGGGTQVKGDIKTKGTLRIDGTVEGNIEADWIILGDKSYFKGNASARGIVVGGIIDGNLVAKEIIEIKQKGQVRGDIVTAKLTVAEGGILEGRTAMRKDEVKALEFSEEELKEPQTYGGG